MESQSKRKKVLLVDDEIEILEVFKDAFEEADYLISSATNVEDALKIIQLEKIDLVITDLRMPGKSGIDLLTSIKKDFKDIPVIICSGFTDYQKSDIQNLGGCDLLIKPISLNDLYNAAKTALAS